MSQSGAISPSGASSEARARFQIRPLEEAQIPLVTAWARQEGFTPGSGDVAIYRQTDRQGLWLGWLDQTPIGCIAGVRYNDAYGFIGLFIVRPELRGQGYGIQLWRHALEHLKDVRCIGLEAAPDRIADYASWGFQPASPTQRWQRGGLADLGPEPPLAPLGTVQDSGLGFGQAATAGTGVGLANIRERLQLLYGTKAGLTIGENPGGGTRVTLSVPYKPVGNAHG